MSDQADHVERAERARAYGPWRAGCLIGVYVLMGLHIAHWKINGTTLAPLELNEVMHTLELGILTAGFILMVVAMASVLVVGRFFCSWGCHILALQDLSAWLLEKVGIRPKPVRMRSLVLVPFGAMLYMFVWPQVERLIAGRPMPVLHITTDESGWASFLTDDFWRNLPGVGVMLFTFFVVGFVIVYLLGSRSFCKYGCPYGALFSLGDRLAPGKIVAVGRDGDDGEMVDCSSCGICTAKCQSGIRVHEELTVYGKVVNPACLKDLDCISNCPEGKIGFGFRMPGLLTSLKRDEGIKRPRYDFLLWEEGVLVVVFFVVLFVYRGLYGLMPFLLTLGLGVIGAWAVVTGLRLLWMPYVRLNRFQFKIGGKVSRSGFVFGLLVVFGVVLTAHSSVIRYHEFVGWRAVGLLDRVGSFDHVGHVGHVDHAEGIVERQESVGAALSHLLFTQRWGLYVGDELVEKLGELEILAAQSMAQGGDAAGALARFEELAVLYPNVALVRYNIGVLLAMEGRYDEAITAYDQSLALDQMHADSWNNVGYLLAMKERYEQAEYCFRAAIERNPDFAHPHYNLARLLVFSGTAEEVEYHLGRAAELDPAAYGELSP
ncbi:MAG: tetratricopeptide repeat protein [Phycisphaerales bacterium]|nr:tetratricopeptide repeat protein [Phycisphaerales bacterium]